MKDPYIYKMLSRAFWAGNRWVVSGASKKKPFESEYKCFHSYKEADDYCIEVATGQPKIGVLGDLLKQMNSGGRKKKEAHSKEPDFNKLMQKHPLVLFPENQDWHFAIRERRFFSVTWQKVIYPLKEIQTFKIFVEGQLYKSFDQFRQANSIFLEMAAQCAGSDNKQALKLIGEIEFSHDSEGSFTFSLELYRFGFNSRRQLFIIEQIRDVTSTLLMPIVYFAKYNYGRARLEFYDGRLRKTLPGMSYTGIDLRNYSGKIL